ncbi:Uncharacterized protein M6B38_211075 [Iris pallida]|uniref:BZIP domain-containing protein n=1 Tax=Iris pallida TaxID=29817 RepID=A0AAX6E441_IRIPA|nr:Uncharacterized protein M6B38_211075 [Iris pallida]
MSSSSQSRSRSPSRSSEEDPRRQLLSAAKEEDRRKRKRMLSNRESARRSRVRKQQHLDELLAQAARLGAENGRVSAQIVAAERHLAGLEGGNAALRAQAAELSGRLRSLGSVLRFVEEFGGAAGRTPEMLLPAEEEEDPRRPWHLPCPVTQHPIMAMHSAGAFGF